MTRRSNSPIWIGLLALATLATPSPARSQLVALRFVALCGGYRPQLGSLSAADSTLAASLDG